MLFFLDSKHLWARVLRRALVVGIFAFVSVVVKEALIPSAPSVFAPVLTAGLAALDKWIRDLLEKKRLKGGETGD